MNISDGHFDQSMKKFILYSMVTHVILILLITYQKQLFLDNEEILIKNAIQVDIVGLPEKEKPKVKELPKQPPPPPKKVVLKKKKVPNTKKIKESQNHAVDRLKAMNAIEKLKKQQELIEQQKKIAETREQFEEAKEKKGNVISDASGLTGLDRIKMQEYYESIRSHVQSYFSVPSFLVGKGLNTKVAIRIDSNGIVISKSILQSSGSVIFDEAVLSSVETASPLPKPPERLQRRLENAGFVLGFPE